MEEPELRIGGWVQQKKRGKIRRLFSFLLIITVGLIVGGPALVSYQSIDINDGSLYLNAGVWNGPFENENTKEFNGHLKISKESYESLDGESGKLIILSLSSLEITNCFGLSKLPSISLIFNGFNLPKPAAAKSRAIPLTPRQSALFGVIERSTTF